jgi:hypothetical protein
MIPIAIKFDLEAICNKTELNKTILQNRIKGALNIT